MMACILSKLVSSLVAVFVVWRWPGLPLLHAACLGILPVWAEVVASLVTKTEPGREGRFGVRLIDNLVDGYVFILVPSLWWAYFHPAAWGLLLFVPAGVFRLQRFVRRGLSAAGMFEGLPVTYTGYLWVVLQLVDHYWFTQIAFSVMGLLMVSFWIKVKPSL